VIRKIERRTGSPCWPILIAFFFLAGCVANAGKKGPEAVSKSVATEPSGTRTEGREALQKQPSDLVHAVRWKGESLSIIAKWYTGKTANWKPLAEYNAMTHPNRIRIGDTVRIPEALLTTRKSLPRAFVEPSEQPSELHDPPEPSPANEAPELFGPKEYTLD